MALRMIGPYRVLETLGSGAMGIVYLAEDTRLHRRVALKTVSEERSGQPDSRRRLLHEARAAARLTHPHVAAIYDVVESSEGVHIVMEYVRGETLAARIARGPLPPAAVVGIGIQLAEALSNAHAMGVLHRDLKPANVMLMPDGQAKILDFGLAKTPPVPVPPSETADASSGSHAHRIVGTPGYVPPESFLGEAPDARGDLYSLGVMLFEMLTGRRPFSGRDVIAVGMAALTEPAPRIRDLQPAVPAGLDPIIARAIAPRPQDRYASAADLAAALQRVEEELVQTHTRSMRAWLPDLPSWRARRSAWAAVALLVAVTSAGVWRLRPLTPTGPVPAVVAVLPFASTTSDPADQQLAAGIADVLISAMAQVPGVTMVSRSATLVYHPRDKPVGSIARELGTDLVVDGAIQRSRDAVRVTLSLLRPESNRVAWSRTYDGTFASIFTLQSEAAAALSEALQVTLTPEDRRRLRPPTTNVEALADYAQARSFLERPDVKDSLDRSIALFQSAIARDPRFARAHAGLGHAYWLKFGETREDAWSEKALLATTESLRLDPEDASVRHALAVVYAGRGRTEEAMEELRLAIKLQPTNDEAHNQLGKILCGRGQRDEGIAELKQAIALRPNYWRHHYELGVVYFDSGRYAEAAAAFRRVTELQPDSARGFLMLGTTHFVSGDAPRAIDNYKRAIAVAPDSAAYTNLGVALYADKRYAEAQRAFEEAVRLSPNAPTKHRNLGDVYARLGQAEKSVQAYARAAELCREQLRTNPKDARTLSMLAVYEAKLGKREEAARHADEAVALSPTLGEVVYRRAVVLALAGRAEESLTALEQAFDRGYSRKLASTDEDLDVLRGRADFLALIGSSAGTPAKGGGG